jgi:hypothetical protein
MVIPRQLPPEQGIPLYTTKNFFLLYHSFFSLYYKEMDIGL